MDVIFSYPICYYGNFSMKKFFKTNILLGDIKGFI